MSNILRQPEESDIQYHQRLVRGKLDDKTLVDYDYSELAPLVYGKEYSADVARRMMYGSHYTLNLLSEAMESHAVKSGSVLLDEIEQQKIESKKERIKFYDQRREFNKMITQVAREEHIKDELIKAANSLNENYPLLVIPPDEEEYGLDEAIIVLNDWHYGQTSENIWNVYNTAICRERVITFLKECLIVLERHNISKVHILLLGDLANGVIHTSSRVASEEIYCEQIMNVSEIVAQFISVIADCTPFVDIHSTYGNHMRSVQNIKDNIHSDNIERLIPWWLKQRLKDATNCTFVDSEYYEFLKLDVCGKSICAVHGDLDNIRDFGVIANTIFTKQYGQTIDYTIVADKHHIEEFERLGIENILVRSLCGTDEYANGKRLYSSPGQSIITFNHRSGRDASYHIKLK